MEWQLLDEVFGLFFGDPGKVPWPSDPSGYIELAALVQVDAITISEFSYQTATVPGKGSRAYRTYEKVARKGGGGEEHSQLKWSAYNWLLLQGERRPRVETAAFGGWGIPDLFSPALGIQVECGNTDPRKAVGLFEHTDIRSFVLFPYSVGTVHYAYAFRPSEAGRRFLNDRSAERMRELQLKIASRERVLDPPKPSSSHS